jgi:sigma-70-like protein
VRDALSHDSRQGFDYLSDALLLAALRRLSVMSREIIVLRYVAGFPMTEIARLIDTTVGAVRQAHYAAMEALRMELLPGGPGGQPRPRPLAMDRLPNGVSRSISHSYTLLNPQRRPAS